MLSRLAYFLYFDLLTTRHCRTAAKLLRQSFSLWTKKTVQASTPFARLITSEDWISSVTSAMERSVGLISRPSIANTTSIISHAPYVRPSLVHKTVIMSMMARCIVTSTTRLNLHNDAMAARLQFSSSLSRFSAMGKINTGTRNVT